MVHSSLHEQDGKVGDSGWLENGELGVVPEVMRKREEVRDVWMSVRESEMETLPKNGGNPSGSSSGRQHSLTGRCAATCVQRTFLSQLSIPCPVFLCTHEVTGQLYRGIIVSAPQSLCCLCCHYLPDRFVSCCLQLGTAVMPGITASHHRGKYLPLTCISCALVLFRQCLCAAGCFIVLLHVCILISFINKKEK